VALLSFCTFQAFPDKTFEKAPAFFISLSPFLFLFLSKQKPGTSGISFLPSGLPLFQGAPTCVVFLIDKRLPFLWIVPCRGLFFQLGFSTPLTGFGFTL
jgi:hypothetical protein